MTFSYKLPIDRNQVLRSCPTSLLQSGVQYRYIRYKFYTERYSLIHQQWRSFRSEEQAVQPHPTPLLRNLLPKSWCFRGRNSSQDSFCSYQGLQVLTKRRHLRIFTALTKFHQMVAWLILLTVSFIIQHRLVTLREMFRKKNQLQLPNYKLDPFLSTCWNHLLQLWSILREMFHFTN